jgi:LuxR family maltose regulon positive regulatory protein
MTHDPIQLAKVLPPPLRDETLARDRLLDWLSAKIHHRLVLVIAEAGYGKTTLLADFTRRTRAKVAWYRLDPSDRDWIVFARYLVAAFRVHFPDFGHRTLAALEAPGATCNATSMALAQDLASLQPLDDGALVLDDFHLVDTSEQVCGLLSSLFAAAPEGLSFVVLSRKAPKLAIARLRTLGEVTELRSDHLRFNEEETAGLFNSVYRMAMDPTLIRELSRRTDGWAASLHMAHSAIQGRSGLELRRFIESLSGSSGDIHDYLAEEVVRDLDPALQAFLMRASLLDEIDVPLAAAAAGVSHEEAAVLLHAAESLGLLLRRADQGSLIFRAHPLVRQFLEARLTREIGVDGVVDVHRQIAEAARARSWLLAAEHYSRAGSPGKSAEVIEGAIHEILGSGAFESALGVMERSDQAASAESLVLGSRRELAAGRPIEAVALADAAMERSGGRDFAVLNAISIHIAAGDMEKAVALTARVRDSDQHVLGRVAASVPAMLATSVEGRIDDARAAFEALVRELAREGTDHFRGVALANLAYLLRAEGDAEGARAHAREAIITLEHSKSRVELVSARLVLAWALAHLGDLNAARQEIDRAAEEAPAIQSLEVAYEACEIEALYGSARRAADHIERVPESQPRTPDAAEQASLAYALALVRCGELERARELVAGFRPRAIRSAVAFELKRLVVAAELAVARGSPSASREIDDAIALASNQRARYWERHLAVLRSVAAPSGAPDAIRDLLKSDPAHVSALAEFVVPALGTIGEAMPQLEEEAARRPQRWRPALRELLSSPAGPATHCAATLLERIGQADDVQLLRRVARSAGSASVRPEYGRTLARRLAPRVYVEDLGPIEIQVGDRVVDRSSVRRKVLALLCYLLTRHRFSATREEVLEALWPDSDPTTALNSLNQTVYFLRRVFEPAYAEEMSPGYLLQDGETVWLDANLVRSRSSDCLELVDRVRRDGSGPALDELADSYRSRFALDFAYEEWASGFRDGLHIAYLRTIEKAIRAESDAGRFERAAQLAELARRADSESEVIHGWLVRLYRLAQAHAAAAEQSVKYRDSLAALGLDPDLDADDGGWAVGGR